MPGISQKYLDSKNLRCLGSWRPDHQGERDEPNGDGMPHWVQCFIHSHRWLHLANRNKSIGIIWNNHTLGWKCNTFESTNRSWHVNLVSQKHLSEMFCSNKISGQNFTIICGKPLSYTTLHQSTCHVPPWSTLWAAACL